MTKNTINSLKGFKYGIISCGLMVIFIILTKTFSNHHGDFTTALIGGLSVGIGGVGVVGLVHSLKGIKEPTTVKKYIGIIINLSIVVLFLCMIFANAYDTYKLFSS